MEWVSGIADVLSILGAIGTVITYLKVRDVESRLREREAEIDRKRSLHAARTTLEVIVANTLKPLLPSQVVREDLGRAQSVLVLLKSHDDVAPEVRERASKLLPTLSDAAKTPVTDDAPPSFPRRAITDLGFIVEHLKEHEQSASIVTRGKK